MSLRSAVFSKLFAATLAAVLACGGTVLFPVASRAQSDANNVQDFRDSELIVEIRPGASVDAVNQRNRTATIQRLNNTNFYRLGIPNKKNLKKWQKMIQADPDVLSAALNPVISSPLSVFGRRTQGFPDGNALPGHRADEYANQTELIAMLNLDVAHLHSTGKGVVVAVIDTGVDLSHPALAAHMWTDTRKDGEIPGDGIDNDGDGYIDDYRGWNFVDNNNDPSESPGDPTTSLAGHGTFIAGLIALAAPGARIMPLKAFPPSGISDAFTVSAAIKFAVDHGANVINLSFGSPRFSGVLADAIDYAKKRCLVLTAAVGNDNVKAPQFPARLDSVIGVAAIDSSDRKAAFSNFGNDVSVDALGVGLISTFPGGDYAVWSGTSFAAPLAAAEAALIFGADPLAGDLTQLIANTAVPIDDVNPGLSGKLGRGRIDPLAAIMSLDLGPSARPATDYYSSLELYGGAGAAIARATSEVSIVGTQQEFSVEGYSLSPRSSCRLFVDGSPIDNAVAVSSDMGGVSFDLYSSPDVGEPALPVGLYPVTGIKQVEIRDEQGNVLLRGTYGAPMDGLAPADEFVQKEALLTATNPAADRGGRAIVYVDEHREGIIIQANGLIPNSVYQLVVDGVVIGSRSALYGFCKLDLTSDGPLGMRLPESLWPVTNIKHIEIRDATGQVVVFQGDIPPGA
jgi:subtilisin family serine protease